MIHTDTFTGADGTNLVGALAPSGAPYLANGSPWTIQGNQCAGGGAVYHQFLVADWGAADCTVSVTLIGSVVDRGLVLRQADASNFIRCIAAATGAVFIQSVVAGVYTMIAGWTVTLGADKVLSVAMSGDTYDVSYDGVLLGSVTDAGANHLTETVHGVYTYGSLTYFDDLTIIIADTDPEPEVVPGAARDVWGDVRLHVWLRLGRGNVMRFGPEIGFGSDWDIDPNLDRLDAGKVVGSTPGAIPTLSPSALPGLWVDVTCDVVQIETSTGATAAAGLYAQTEAGSATITMADPTRRYDPVNPDSTWGDRLAPGLGVLIWAETDDQRFTLFIGKADTIAEPWTPHPSARRATLVASDGVADLANRERPALAVPAETTTERVARILDYYNGPDLMPAGVWLPGMEPPDVHLQPAILTGSAWEELQRVVDDEVGFLYLRPRSPDPYQGMDWVPPVAAGTVATEWMTRRQLNAADPVWTFDDYMATLDCALVIAAVVTASDGQQRTRVTGRRALAPDEEDVIPTQRSEHTRSVPALREMGYSKADLGVVEDEVVPWVEHVLAAFQTPDVEVRSVTLRPAAVADAWPMILRANAELALHPVRLEWEPPGEDVHYSVRGRVVGVEHSITTARWEVRWHLTQTTIAVSE